MWQPLADEPCLKILNGEPDHLVESRPRHMPFPDVAHCHLSAQLSQPTLSPAAEESRKCILTSQEGPK